MSHQVPSLEARQALFCATVVSAAAGEAELTNRRVAAAVLGTGEVQAICHAAGVYAEALVRAIDGVAQHSYLELLESVARSLATANMEFGSRPHIASIRPLRLAEHTQRALLQRTEEVEAIGRGVNSVDILLAVLQSDTRLAVELSEHGVTIELLRTVAS